MEISTKEEKKRPSNPKKIAFGLLVSLAGIFLLLFNLGIIPPELKHYFFSWSSLILSLGIINLIDRKSRIFGIVLLIISAISYFHHLNIYINFWGIVLPIALIFIGILIILHKFIHPEACCLSKEKTQKQANRNEEYIDEKNIFSGSERRFVNVPFKGGSINNIFGGSEIDLTLANLGMGKNVLEINCVFGGVSIIVPHNWKISIKVNAVLGAFDDKRYISSGENEMLQGRELIIIGNLVMSGGELKSR